MESLNKGLYIISTPIGNLDDMSFRSVNILKQVDFIICENPKHSLKLLNKFGIKKKLYSLHDYNEKSLIKKIEKHKNNSSIALISDAGSPLISDPGFKLVKDFIENNIFLTSIPGPSSVITSLQLSGLPLNNFVFFGFVPKTPGKIKILADRADEINLTSVFFVSGNKIEGFLRSFNNTSLERKVAICKELTKINENIVRGSISEILQKIAGKEINLKGEFTLIIGNVDDDAVKSINSDVKKYTKKLLKKYTLTEVVEIVHKLSNISKKNIYQMALKNKDD